MSTTTITHEQARQHIASRTNPVAGQVAARLLPGEHARIIKGRHAGRTGTIVAARRIEIHPDAEATIKALRGHAGRREHYLVILDGATSFVPVTIDLDAADHA